MSAGHKHAFTVDVDTVAAHSACRRFHLSTLFLAVFFLYFNLWQFRNRVLLGLFGFTLTFLLRHTSNYFKQCLFVKLLLEVAHEVVRIEVLILSSHPKKLMACKNVHERPD